MTQVTVNGDVVIIERLEVLDPLLAEMLSRQHQASEQLDFVRRVLEVGVRGLINMGIGVDLGEVDGRVRRSLDQITAEAEDRFGRLLTELSAAVQVQMDPERRSSVVAKVIGELDGWREQLVRRLDPDRADSDTSRLLRRLDDLLGPGGGLEQRLASALDPKADGSALAEAFTLVGREIRELREGLAEQRGKNAEAVRGTAKGIDFEEVMDQVLRGAARAHGAVVERTSRTPGVLGADAMVGDFVFTLPGGERIVVEAKNSRSLDLTGAKGVLAELDRAMINRTAVASICVSALDAYPQEVGSFGVYGNRILVVDDGEGTMTWVALRWATASLAAAGTLAEKIDLGAAEERLQRMRQLCSRFASQKSALTEVNKSVAKVQDGLTEMRSELLSLIDDLGAQLRGVEAAEVLPITRQAG